MVQLISDKKYFMRTIIFLTSVLLSLGVFAQEEERATLKRLKKDKKIQSEYAQKAIQDLKQKGVILVRLNFRQKQVDYLMKNGNQKYAQRIIDKSKLDNQYIAKAFNDEFDFCPVYFFKMIDSRKIADQKYDSVQFFNSMLDSVSFSVDSQRVFIAEFGSIKQDTARYLSGYTQKPGDSVRQPVYYGGSKNTRSALVVMNERFQQIQSPFPYFAPYSALASRKKKYIIAVGKLNKRFNNYLSVQKGD